MESGALPVVAVYLLARIEAGQVEFKRGVPVSAEEPQVRLPSSRQLSRLKEELDGWGYGGNLRTTLELLVRAGLVVREGDRLALTPMVYSWLQLPPAPMLRFLAESARALPDPALLKLLRRGVTAEEAGDKAGPLKRLALVGLVQDYHGLYYARGRDNVRLLELYTSLPPDMPPDHPALLELGALWQRKYPGNWPEGDWLKWHQAEFCFSFTCPQPDTPRTFQPWQLFRLLGLCQIRGSNATELVCTPAPEYISTAGNEGLSFEGVMTYLTGGLARTEPELARRVREWYREGQRFRVIKSLVLEAATREDMRRILSNRRLRPYISQLLSPRHALLGTSDIGQFSRMLLRRGMYLSGQNVEARKSQTELKLSRRQLAQILTALICYRRRRVEIGAETLYLDDLLAHLGTGITAAERREAYRLAEETCENPEPATGKMAQLGDVTDLKNLLELAIIEEAELLVEYETPGKGRRQRRIEPLFLEEKEGLVYLTAYCFLRKEERVFRLDRLRVLGNS